jgi:serine/threonine-protein kinase
MSQDPNQKAQRAPGFAATEMAPSVPIPSSGTGSQTTGLKLVNIRPAVDSIVEPVSGVAPPTSKPDPLVGYTIDNRYKVESVLGEGGMGVVYRCRHKIIDKKVAMKVLRADMARDKEATERFLMEAKAASAIGDDHIIDISDFGLLPDGSTYFVMEYLDGTPLSTIVNGNPVPVARILKIARQLAEGLAAAHEAGIVHRDLKPDNIFLITRGGDKDFVKILDFGIAKVPTSSAGLTRAGSVFGTPHYMSPEQAAGAAVDHRGDVYSFGVILYELACGKVPFDADNFMGILTQHMYKAPVPIRALVPPPQEVPPGLDAIVLKCLSKRPEQRYGSMRELQADIDKLRDGLVPDAVGEMMARSGGFNVPADFFKVQGRMPAPVPATPAGVPTKSRSALIAGIAGVLVAVGLVVAIFAQSKSSPASPPTAAAPVTPPPEAPPSPEASNDIVVSSGVAVAADPLDAEVWKGSQNLGTSPVIVDVPEGTPVAIEIRRAGYLTKKLVLDGRERKVTVRLDKERATAPVAVGRPKPGRPAPPAPEPVAKPKPKTSAGGGEIVNPWAR